MKPLRIAWRHRTRAFHPRWRGGSEGNVLAWRGRFVVVAHANAGVRDLGAIVDRDGKVAHEIEVPLPSTRDRSPSAPACTWPDEELVVGVHTGDDFHLAWLDLEGAAHMLQTELAKRAPWDRWHRITPTTDGGVLVSGAVARARLDEHDWPLDKRLDAMFGTIRRGPFDDFDYITMRLERRGARWEVSGRVGCVADDVVVIEQGSGRERAIVAVRASDASTLWRRPAIDAFVLGAIPMPAWSDDRVYVLDRGARRAQAWAREAEVARIHQPDVTQPFRTIASARPLAEARLQQRITAPSLLSCLSTRTGDALWTVEVPGDVVSFHCTPWWLACTVAGGQLGTLHVWRHDGTPVGEGTVDVLEAHESTAWPPDAGRWPCIVHGDEQHVVVVQNRSRSQPEHRLHAATLARPTTPQWTVPMPGPVVVGSVQGRYHRLLNRVPIAVLEDAAVLRWGNALYGMLPA